MCRVSGYWHSRTRTSRARSLGRRDICTLRVIMSGRGDARLERGGSGQEPAVTGCRVSLRTTAAGRA